MRKRQKELTLAEEKLSCFIMKDPENPDNMLIPSLTTVGDMILNRFPEVMVRGLNESLHSRQLDGLLEEVVTTASFGPADIHLYQNGITCYRRNAREVLADIRFWTTVNILEEDREVFFPADLGMTLLISFFPDSVECSCEGVWDLCSVPDRADMVKLDDFLCPAIPQRGLESFADSIWLTAGVNGIDDRDSRTPELLAAGLGLTIVEKPVNSWWSAALCVTEHTLPVFPEACRGGSEAAEETFPAGTLIVNTRARYRANKLDLYRNCVNREWYSLFYRLQGAPTDNPHDIPKISVPKRQKVDLKGLLLAVEKANRLAYSVMLPRKVMETYIDQHRAEAKVAPRFHGYRNHRAAALEYIGKQIREEEKVFGSWVRARFLQMGDPQARNIFNMTDGHCIDAYATRDNSLDSGDFTLAIGYRARVLDLFHEDPLFQEVMESGDWVWADGLIVRDHPNYLTRTFQGPRITPQGNNAADRCCLRFSQKWHPSFSQYSYAFGKANREWMDTVWRPYEETDSARALRASREQEIQRLKAIPTFGEALSWLIRTRTTPAELDKAVQLSGWTVREYCNPENRVFDPDDVTQLCIQLHLKPWQSRILFEKAGLEAWTEAGHDVNSRWAMVCCLYQEDVKDLSHYLEDIRLNHNDIPAFGKGGKGQMAA